LLLFSFDYEDAGYQAADLIKMDILINMLVISLAQIATACISCC